METNQNHKDLEACLRTFRKLAFKIDEMNTKLTHIIEDLREIYYKKTFDEPYQYPNREKDHIKDYLNDDEEPIE